MNGAQKEEGSSVFHNSRPPLVPNHSPSTPPTDHNFKELSEEGCLEVPEEDPPVVQIEVGVVCVRCLSFVAGLLLQRDLDELTYSGAAINDLEMQLIRSKHLYQQVLVDGKLHVDMLRRKLHSHIIKSDPFIEIWRKARLVGIKWGVRIGREGSHNLAS